MKSRKIISAVIGLAAAVTMAACGSSNTARSSSAKTIPSSASSTSVPVSQSDEITGGWNINTDSVKIDDNADAKKAFEEATKDITGYDYEVTAYLGSQVVSGTNYAYLCKGQAVTPDAEPEYLIVYVYEDLNGNAKLVGSKDIELDIQDIDQE